MAAATTPKPKSFRVGVSGATTDGRTISRDWISQMAANYQPETYTALLNLEHFKGIFPDGPFRSYGKVTALTTEEVAVFGKKELALVATIEPTADLVAINQKSQKLFTSMEVNPKFADTGQAYLVALAVTDDPASLGTQELKFCNQKAGKTTEYSGAYEFPGTFFDPPPEPGLMERVKALFSSKSGSDAARFGEQEQAILAVAESQKGVLEKLSAAEAAVAKVAPLEQQVQKLTAELTELKTQLSAEPSGQQRPPVGGADLKLTDF